MIYMTILTLSSKKEFHMYVCDYVYMYMSQRGSILKFALTESYSRKFLYV